MMAIICSRTVEIEPRSGIFHGCDLWKGVVGVVTNADDAENLAFSGVCLR